MSGEDKDEVRRILSNIQNNIDFLNRKYPYLEFELEKDIQLTSSKYKYRLVVYVPREEIVWVKKNLIKINKNF